VVRVCALPLNPVNPHSTKIAYALFQRIGFPKVRTVGFINALLLTVSFVRPTAIISLSEAGVKAGANRRKTIRYGSTGKGALLESVPACVVTSILPVVAPQGTVALSSEGETVTKVVDTPLKLTPFTLVTSLPRIRTLTTASYRGTVEDSIRALDQTGVRVTLIHAKNV
jgi:hypothetical protein